MNKGQAKKSYEEIVKPYLETKDPLMRKRAVEVACDIFTPFIKGYSSQRHGKLGKYSIKTTTGDIKSTAYFAVAAHLDQAKPVDFLMFCKYMITWIRKEVSKVCHFDEDYLCTFSDIADRENVYEVPDPNASTEKDALFLEVYEMMREVVSELPPAVRDSLRCSYIREDTTWDMRDRLPYYTTSLSYWKALQRAVPLLRKKILEKFGEQGYAEIEEFFIQEDFS